jgi:hypothetical protein
MKYIFGTLAFAALTACGGSNMDSVPSGPTVGQLQNQIVALQADQRRISDQTITSFANMPTTGSSTFNGGVVIGAERGATDINLIGDSSLTVNFASEQMTGRANNFRGFNADGQLFNASGQLNYSGGAIGVDGDARNLTYNVNGNLGAGTDILAVNGAVVGQFSGNRTNGPIRTKAFQAVGGSAGSTTATLLGVPTLTSTINGGAAATSIAIIGEN